MGLSGLGDVAIAAAAAAGSDGRGSEGRSEGVPPTPSLAERRLHVLHPSLPLLLCLLTAFLPCPSPYHACFLLALRWMLHFAFCNSGGFSLFAVCVCLKEMFLFLLFYLKLCGLVSLLIFIFIFLKKCSVLVDLMVMSR